MTEHVPCAAPQDQTVPGEPACMPLSAALETFERRYILRVLRRCRGHKADTARALGINRKTLYKKLKKYQCLQELS